jgi:hypothetical protein
MEKFQNFLLGANTKHRVKMYGAGLMVVLTAAFILVHRVQAQGQEVQQGLGHEPFRFSLSPASDTIAACLPNAAATVSVLPKEDSRGVDTLDLNAQGLPPNTEFAVFLTESAVSVGAVQYIGDFTTNPAGRGSMRVNTIVDDAFSSTVVNGARVRSELNHIVMWFADPNADNACFAPQTGPITPFDGDGQAGAAALSSKNFLPGAPLP